MLTVRRSLGLSSQLHTEDRRVLEQVILPEYARRTDIARILFVGCAAYTQHYEELFGAREYWTIDPVARRSRHGGQRHIVDQLQNLGRHARADYFDLIICNGVLGWGLNDPEDVESAFSACLTHLRAGGELMLGWNDIAPRNRVLPEAILALRQFEHARFEPAQTSRWAIDATNRHVFNFYRKPRRLTSKSHQGTPSSY